MKSSSRGISGNKNANNRLIIYIDNIFGHIERNLNIFSAQLTLV
jgi:hypothetical protein